MLSLRKYMRYLVSSPKLYRIYPPPRPTPTPTASKSSGLPSTDQSSTPTTNDQVPRISYTPSILESLSDATLSYVIPITILLCVYNRKLTYLQITAVLYISCRVLRGISRLTNSSYREFLEILDNAVDNPRDNQAIEQLRCFDFEFKYFPTDYTAIVDITRYISNQDQVSRGIMWYVSWAVAHSFGIRLIYPGLILGGLLRGVLEDGRARLVTEKRGKRVKICCTSDHACVSIDAIVLDRRYRGGKGHTLIICCEGNAGFYEIGMLGGALSEGYSVLGWNHPGFGGSSGTPYPAHELTGATGVFEYAINVLGFKEHEIIVHGWSIGGFPASYLASQYPRIKGLILDATFDNVLPLAIPRMPGFLSGVTTATIKSHVNLDNLANLKAYKGPIRIVRRTEDEIIGEQNDMSTNRGNYLLLQHVLDRYGEPVSSSARNGLLDWINTPHDTDHPAVDCLSNETFKFPTNMAQETVLISIASSILRDFKSTHCTPLPKEYFRIK